VSKIRLTDKSSGEEVGLIENKPGSAGSVRVYSYLIDTFGNSTDLTVESIAVFEFFFQEKKSLGRLHISRLLFMQSM
jgi:hypothetical protein